MPAEVSTQARFEKAQELLNSVHYLVTNLTGTAIQEGNRFGYDGIALTAEQVADYALPSILSLAQSLADRLDVKQRFGFTFANEARSGQPFPLVIQHSGGAVAPTSTVALFVRAIFKSDSPMYEFWTYQQPELRGIVMRNRTDLARVFEAAMRERFQPDYTLGKGLPGYVPDRQPLTTTERLAASLGIEPT
jgi:hypothetical protein